MDDGQPLVAQRRHRAVAVHRQVCGFPLHAVLQVHRAEAEGQPGQRQIEHRLVAGAELVKLPNSTSRSAPASAVFTVMRAAPFRGGRRLPPLPAGGAAMAALPHSRGCSERCRKSSPGFAAPGPASADPARRSRGECRSRPGGAGDVPLRPRGHAPFRSASRDASLPGTTKDFGRLHVRDPPPAHRRPCRRAVARPCRRRPGALGPGPAGAADHRLFAWRQHRYRRAPACRADGRGARPGGADRRREPARRLGRHRHGMAEGPPRPTATP